MFEPDFIESGTKERIQTPRNAPIEAFDQICQSHNTSVVCNPLVWSKSTCKLVAKGVQSCMVYITGVLVEPADILYFKAFLFAVTKSLRLSNRTLHQPQRTGSTRALAREPTTMLLPTRRQDNDRVTASTAWGQPHPGPHQHQRPQRITYTQPPRCILCTQAAPNYSPRHVVRSVATVPETIRRE